jgi:hypothetical protein
MRLNILLVVCVVIPSVALGGAGQGQAAADGATLDDLSWLSGYWLSTDRGVRSEECWLAADGGVMLGLHRDNDDEGGMMFEYLRIMETAGGLVYYATPQGYETTKFTMISYTNSGDTREAVFENPEHDFPQRIRYTRIGRRLTAEISGIDDGQKIVQVWAWTRTRFPDQE